MEQLLARLFPRTPAAAPEPASALAPTEQQPPQPEQIAPGPAVAPPPAAPVAWENYICLNFENEPDFRALGPAAQYRDTDTRRHEWADLDYAEAIARDIHPLPMTEDREGYYGPDHFSYWASGLLDARYLIAAAREHGVTPATYLDIGCASGRVLRHMAQELPGLRAIGCDINRLHVEWCNRYLPRNCEVFHSHSIPSLPLPDNAVDVISAYSVFTHIEAMETAWLMELRRILRPGGIAWITVHSEKTLEDMQPGWPLWDPVMLHPEAPVKLDGNRHFKGDRLVLRWQAERSYSSNVFYKLDYLERSWSRILEIAEVRRRFPSFQDVLILKKPL